MLTLINPIPRAEPFDHPEWVFEAKYDGFRAVADTARGRLTSRNGARMPRFEAAVLDLLPKGCLFDGELVVLDDDGRPLFNELMFGRGRPTYVAFDLLMTDGEDLRPLPLRERKARLAAIGKGAEAWIALTNGLVGEGCALFSAVVAADHRGASSPSGWPTPITRSSPAGTRCSTAAIRSVTGAPNGFVSVRGVMLEDDERAEGADPAATSAPQAPAAVDYPGIAATESLVSSQGGFSTGAEMLRLRHSSSVYKANKKRQKTNRKT